MVQNVNKSYFYKLQIHSKWKAYYA